MRHHSKSQVSNNVCLYDGGVLPGGAPEGSAFPSIEHLLQREGCVQAIMDVLGQAFFERAVVVTYKTKDGEHALPLAWEDCTWKQLCALAWQAKEVPRQTERHADFWSTQSKPPRRMPQMPISRLRSSAQPRWQAATVQDTIEANGTLSPVEHNV